MAKFKKAFRGVPDGEIYPKDYVRGDECPPELEEGARELGALDDSAPTPPPEGDDVNPDPSASDASGAAEGDHATGTETVDVPDKAVLIAKLEEAKIAFDKRWGVEKLQAALDSGKKD